MLLQGVPPCGGTSASQHCDACIPAISPHRPPAAHYRTLQGLLLTPLLRHQRIALAWMSRREEDGAKPMGGILADDQVSQHGSSFSLSLLGWC